MKREFKGLCIILVAVLLFSVSFEAQATWMRRVNPTGNVAATIGGNVPYDNVTNSTATYVNNFVTDAEFVDATYSIRGSWGSDPTMADQYDTYVMTHVDSVNNVDPAHPEWALPANTVGVGRTIPGNTANWFDGFIAWHVKAPNGMYFTGGTVTLEAHAEGIYNAGYLDRYQFKLFTEAPEISTYAIAPAASDTSVVETNFSQYKDGPGNVSHYDEDLVINIPAGVTSFYLLFDSNGGATNNTAYIKSLSIDAEVAIGEMPVVLWAGAGHELMQYKWENEVENTIGMSGYKVGNASLSSDPCDSALSQAAKDAMAAGRAIGIDYFAYGVALGYGSDNFSAATFQPPASIPGDPNEPNDVEWKYFMDVIEVVADECGQNGVAVCIIDVEKYDSGIDYSNYMFTRGGATDPCELYWAYQRGAQVAELFQQYAPDTAIMLIPEHCCQTYWGGENSAWTSWRAMDRFRNGLMSVSNPNIKVWVGTEGTYGLNGNDNDTEISLRVNNVNTFFDDPVVYRAALDSYLAGIAADCCDTSDDQTVWENYGGIAPGFSVLGVGSTPEGQQSAWYTPEMFAAQMDGFVANPSTRMIWSWCWRFPYAQWSYNQVAAAGLQPFDGNSSNPDYWTSYFAQVAKHPYLDAYLAVMKSRGTPSLEWISTIAYDINGDDYVNMVDVAIIASNWLEVSPKNSD